MSNAVPANRQPNTRSRLLADPPATIRVGAVLRALDRDIGVSLPANSLAETMLLRMTVPQHDTTTLVVLGLVALQPGSGYDLARLAERSVGYLWAPSRSQIYKVLPRLVAHRLAIAKTVRQQNRPDKAVYAITPAGRRALRRWLSQVEEEPSGSANLFALKLFFCDLVPQQSAQAQLDGYRRWLDSRLKRFQEMLRAPAQGREHLSAAHTQTRDHPNRGHPRLG